MSSAVGIPITVQPWNELAWLTDPSVVAEALNREFEETRPEDVEGGTLGTWSRSVVRRRTPQRVRASRRLSCSRFAVREGNAPQQRGKRAFARGKRVHKTALTSSWALFLGAAGVCGRWPWVCLQGASVKS